VFSGIIRGKGRVVSLAKRGGTSTLRVRILAGRLGTLRTGDSVCVSGACLTLTARNGKTLAFDLLPETLKRTHFKDLRARDTVNLEPSVRRGERLHGHIVSGHVEGVARIRKTTARGRTATWTVSLPAKLRRSILPKGSVALEGVSLTVGRMTRAGFEVHLVPHTLKSTNLKEKRRGDRLNIETDERYRRPG